MTDIRILSRDVDTSKQFVVISWEWKGDDYAQFLVVPIKEWNRHHDYEQKLRNTTAVGKETARFFLMKLDVIPMDEAYLSPVDATPVHQYE